MTHHPIVRLRSGTAEDAASILEEMACGAVSGTAWTVAHRDPGPRTSQPGREAAVANQSRRVERLTRDRQIELDGMAVDLDGSEGGEVAVLTPHEWERGTD